MINQLQIQIIWKCRNLKTTPIKTKNKFKVKSNSKKVKKNAAGKTTPIKTKNKFNLKTKNKFNLKTKTQVYSKI